MNTVSVRARGRGWLSPWLAVGALGLAYVVVWALSPLVMDRMPSDLDLYFWPSAQIAVHGHPLLVYSTHLNDVNPNANGPVGLIPLLPAVAIGNALGLSNEIGFRAGAAGVIGAIFALLMTGEALRLVRTERGSLDWWVAASCVFLAAPALLISVGDYGHPEQPLELWLVLLAVRWAAARRVLLTGVALGLAVLTRTIAALYVIPFALVPVMAARWRRTLALVGTTVAVVAIGLAPFLVADGANVVHSLITYRGARLVGGGSVWVLAANTPLGDLAQQADVYLAAGVAAVLCGWLVWRAPAAATTSRGLLGLLTIVAACLPMLVKTVYPYYVFEPYVFGAVWWLARPGSVLSWRILVPLLLTGEVFMAKWQATLPLTGLGALDGVLSSLVFAIVTAVVCIDFLITSSGGAASPASPRSRVAAGPGPHPART